MKEPINFDIEGAIQALREGKDLGGKDDIFTPLIKQLTETALQAELHLATEQSQEWHCQQNLEFPCRGIRA